MRYSAAVLEQSDAVRRAPTTAVAEIADLHRYTRREAQGITKVERLNGNVGYLRMREFVDPAFAGAHLAAAMTLLSGTDALLVDLRYCRGGSPAAVQFLCSYFFDAFREPVHLNDIVEGSELDDPVLDLLLAAVRAVSGPAGLRAHRSSHLLRRRGVRLQHEGDRPGDAGGGTDRRRRAPELDGPADRPLRAHRPHARSVNPITGTNWEGTGITPDVAVREDEAYPVAYRTALRR